MLRIWAPLIPIVNWRRDRACKEPILKRLTDTTLNTIPSYLHWSLPSHYRVGIAGSSSTDSVNATQDALKYGGFNTSGQAFSGNQPGTPVFRSVPERWFIMRTVRPAAGGSSNNRIMVQSGQSEVDAPATMYNSVTGDSSSIMNMFVVQAVSFPSSESND